VPRPIAFTHANFGGKTRHQFVTKTRSFGDIFAMVRTGKAKQAKRFSFLTTQLTRWRPAVRARTGLPYFSITSRMATAFRGCFATWFASHLFLHIKDRLASVRPLAVVSVTPYSARRWSAGASSELHAHRRIVHDRETALRQHKVDSRIRPQPSSLAP
jgi:hypothetical protein